MSESQRIFISNRLPFSVDAKTGELKRGSGGLVSALLGVNLDRSFSWFGFETEAEDARRLREKISKQYPQLHCEPVLLDKKLYTRYYDGFSNDVLWPLFHYEGNNTLFRRDNWEAYQTANRLMADKITETCGDDDEVWIHDFHFLMLPQYLREKKPNLKIGFFLHIPFPSTEIYRQLPVRTEILRAMSQCDLVGFHEYSYMRHFSLSLQTLLGVESNFFRAEIGGHVLHMGVYPISVDNQELHRRSKSAEVRKQAKIYHEGKQAEFLVLGIDRLDYTKGVELKLRGFRRALQKYPELRGKVQLLQIAVPTRTGVPAYRKLRTEVEQLVGAINGDYGSPGYTPVSYIYNSVSQVELLAIYRTAEAALITSKRDGMNLVAMEYVLCQDLNTPGSLILSEFAGSASLLSEAQIINPWDVDAVADAVHTAYGMPLEQRRFKMEKLQNILSRYSASQWAENFLRDLDRVTLQKNPSHGVRLSPLRNEWSAEMKSTLQKAGKIHLVLDYDGTLVSLQRRPELALIALETLHLLEKLKSHYEICVLSGRSQEFLDQQFPQCSFWMGAEHGAFLKGPGTDWQSRVSSDIQSWYPDVRRIMKDYARRVPLSFVEEKRASVCWHYRESPEGFADFQSRKLHDELEVGLANRPVSVMLGSKIVEARAVECNKGDFIRWLMPQIPAGDLVLCLGDDRTDEEMFRALKDDGLSVKVGQEATAANYRLWHQEQVPLFLAELLRFAEEKDARKTVPSAKTNVLA